MLKATCQRAIAIDKIRGSCHVFTSPHDLASEEDNAAGFPHVTFSTMRAQAEMTAQDPVQNVKISRGSHAPDRLRDIAGYGDSLSGVGVDVINEFAGRQRIRQARA